MPAVRQRDETRRAYYSVRPRPRVSRRQAIRTGQKRWTGTSIRRTSLLLHLHDVRFYQVRDEHRQDYDPGRGGWGAQAQRLEIERRREVEERYADAQDGPGAVAGGGGDWKEAGTADNPLKRARSPDDEGDSGRTVSFGI